MQSRSRSTVTSWPPNHGVHPAAARLGTNVTDWYRRTSWTPDDEQDFFARLARSRTRCNKSQYLRIQAVHLAGTGDPRYLEAALSLMDMLIRDYPEPSELACAYWHRARWYERLDQLDEAMVAYREALKAQEQYPQVKTGAALDFAWFIATRRMRLLYAEALRLVESPEPSLFPVDVFRSEAIRAMLAADRGDRASAARFAQAALESAQLKDSGFRYHKTIGLVGQDYKDVVQQLRQWAVG